MIIQKKFDYTICGADFTQSYHIIKEPINIVFADPPYNIQNEQHKGMKYTTSDAMIAKNWQPHYAAYDTINDYWTFTFLWLSTLRDVLASNGTVFITGTHHNIHHIGLVLKELGYWIIQEIAWYKPNAMPNLAMTNMTQAVEWMIWARKSEKHTHYYDKTAARSYTANGTNLRTMWEIPKPSEKQWKYPGKKPVALVYRALDIATDKTKSIVFLDPFCGSGTTGVAAWQLQDRYNNNVRGYLFDKSTEAATLTQYRMEQCMLGKER